MRGCLYDPTAACDTRMLIKHAGVQVVNVGHLPAYVAVRVEGVPDSATISGAGNVTTLTGDHASLENSFDEPRKVPF